MSRYRVYMVNTVSTSVIVDAETEEEAIEKAADEGLPGLMMLDHRYPDDSGWEPTEAEEVPDAL